MPKVINAKTEIIDTDSMSRLQMMELAGRICYRTEDKINPESAAEFIGKVIKNKHGSVTEFAVFTVVVETTKKNKTEFLSLDNKYLTIDIVGKELLVTGTVRAFRESYQNNNNKVINSIIKLLKERWTDFFGMFADPVTDSKIRVDLLSITEVDELPKELKKRHRWVMVKYTVNRAVSHELVRHRPCSWLQESQRYCRYDDDKFGNTVTFIRPTAFGAITENPDALRLWRDSIIQSEQAYLSMLAIDGVSPQAARTVLPNSCKTELYQWCNLEEYDIFFGLRDSVKAEPSMQEVATPLHEQFKMRFPTIF